MKLRLKIFLPVMALLLCFQQMSFASVGITINDAKQGEITDINFVDNTGTGIVKNHRSVTVPVLGPSLFASGTANGGATSMTTAELAVPVAYAFVRKAISADSAFSAGTLANGEPGQVLTVFITAVSGSGTFVITPTTKTGFTTLTFDAARDTATLLYVNDTLGWVLQGYTSVTIGLP